MRTRTLRKPFAIASWLLIAALAVAPSLFATPRRRQPKHPRTRAPKETPSPRARPAHAAPAPAERDPFAPLVSDAPADKPLVFRPRGKPGLAIAELTVEGTVLGPHGAVAVVSSPAGHVYFLHAGDRLFDGTVKSIGRRGVVFIERERDAFGRVFVWRVSKPVEASGGMKP